MQIKKIFRLKKKNCVVSAYDFTVFTYFAVRGYLSVQPISGRPFFECAHCTGLSVHNKHQHDVGRRVSFASHDISRCHPSGAQGAGGRSRKYCRPRRNRRVRIRGRGNVLIVNGARYRQHRGLWQHRSKCRPIKQPLTSIASVSGSRASNKN